MAHFAQNWANITGDKWVLSLIQKRVQNSFQGKTNFVPGPCLLPAASRSAAGRGSRQPSIKGGSGANNSGMSGILFQNFSSSQEERETQADNRSLCTQQFCRHPELQNGDTEKSQKCCLPQRLGIFIGTDGCLFACPDTSSVSQIPQVHTERSSVPVQGSSIQSFDQSSRVHSPYVRYSNVSKEKGNNSSSLSRRLVISKPKSSNTVGTQTIHIVSDQFTRSDNQLREIRPSSSSSVHIHRDGVSHTNQYCQSTSSESSENIGGCETVLTEINCVSQRFPVPLGTTGCSSGFCNAGSVTTPASTNGPAQPVETPLNAVRSPDRFDNGHFTSPEMVAAGRSVPSGSSSEGRSSLPHNVYGRQSYRLGSTSGTGGTSVSWCMDRRPIPASYQSVGDEGHIFISNSGSAIRKELHCSDCYRQHHSGGLHKTLGRDSFPRPMFGSLGHSEHVLDSQHSVTSQAHTRSVQYSSGSDVQNGQTNLHRVVPEPGNRKRDFQDHGIPVNRSVCYPSEPQAATICVTHTGSERSINRCSIDGLEMHSRICISTIPSHSTCDKQNTVISVQNHIDSASLARQTVVSRTTPSVGVTTGISTSISKPVNSAKRKNTAPKSGSTATSRLGIVKQSLRDKQFSSEVADHVSKARRESTVKVYDAKWQIFCCWAHQRKIDPIQATPQIVADFLTLSICCKEKSSQHYQGV